MSAKTERPSVEAEQPRRSPPAAVPSSPLAGRWWTRHSLLGAYYAVALYCFAPWSWLALGAAGLFALVVLREPWVWLPVVAFFAPLYLLPKLTPLPFSPLEFAIVVGGGAALARLVLRRPSFVLRPPSFVTTAALVFAGAAIVATLLASHRAEALRALRVTVLEPIFVYFLAQPLLRERRHVLLTAVGLVAGTSVASALGLGQYFTSAAIAVDGVRRIHGLYNSPNNLALVIDRALPIAAALFVWHRIAAAGFAEPGRWLRALWAGATALLAVALVLTFSLGGWLATAAAGLTLAAFRGRRTLLWSAVGLAALVLAIAVVVGAGLSVPFLPTERIVARFNGESGTGLFRLYLWQSAVAMLADHPIFGVGPDNFLYAYPNYMLDEAWREPFLSHPHNLVLDFWLSTGALGLVAGLSLFASAIAHGVRWHRLAAAEATSRLLDPRSSDHRSAVVRRPSSVDFDRALAAGLTASFVASIVHGLVDNSYFLPDLALSFWIGLVLVRRGFALAGEGETH